MELPKKKYQIIYADPPWEYRLFSNASGGRTAASHYDTMRLTDIYQLPIQDIADNDCALFLWATCPTLPEALFTMKMWGFHYKTVAFTWVKRNKKSNGWFWGMGCWTRANSELCLLGTKGKPQRKRTDISQLIYSPLEHHSKKPDIVRKKIIQLCGDIPRIELFARQKIKGWDVWGNEIETDIKL